MKLTGYLSSFLGLGVAGLIVFTGLLWHENHSLSDRLDASEARVRAAESQVSYFKELRDKDDSVLVTLHQKVDALTGETAKIKRRYIKAYLNDTPTQVNHPNEDDHPDVDSQRHINLIVNGMQCIFAKARGDLPEHCPTE